MVNDFYIVISDETGIKRSEERLKQMQEEVSQVCKKYNIILSIVEPVWEFVEVYYNYLLTKEGKEKKRPIREIDASESSDLLLVLIEQEGADKGEAFKKEVKEAVNAYDFDIDSMGDVQYFVKTYYKFVEELAKKNPQAFK